MQDIFRDTLIATADVSANRFVKATGASGATVNPYGVSLFGALSGKPCDVVALGLAEVEIASGQTPVVGDLVASDADGKAIVDNTTGKILVKKVLTSTVEVLIR
ncbi:MAG: DUF2190 family protein [Spirochaetes bacterium]|nr:DUF2190 family protein [Spirochaetota bacterium]